MANNNTDIASTLINFLAKNPQLITQFLDHPYSVTQKATGASEKLSQQDMSQVVTAAAAMSTGKSVDFSNLASVAATLLSQNGGSVHSLTNALFGTSAQAQTIQQQQAAAAPAQQAASTIDLGTLVNLAGALMGSGSSANTVAAQPTGASLVDLSDGFDVKDVIGLASIFLSSK